MVVTAIVTYSQAPQKLSYQAVIRNSSGQLVTNHAVGMKISILQGSASGTVVYSETFNPIPQTNANGLVTIEIGGGTPVTGTFSTINWGNGPFYLKIETDPAGGFNYTITGISQLLTVPYSLYSNSASTAANAVILTGDQTISGKKTFNSDLIVNTLTVGIGSGNNTDNTSFGYHALFNNLTGGGNTANGYGALGSNTSGDYNTAIGLNALVLNKSGKFNVAIGQRALRNNNSGEHNTAIGSNTLQANTAGAGNIAIGNGALYASTGSGSTGIGYNAGYSNSGNNNVFLGNMAGYWDTGSNKLFIDNQQRANETDARSKALIYGVFHEDPWNQVVALNARVGIGTSNPGTRLSIVGLTSASAGSTLIISGNNVYIQSSILCLKDDIQPLNDDFGKILNTSPVSFTDKNTGMPGIGYIAEDFENAGLQNLLVYENGKLVSLRYDLVSVYNLEVIKELKKHVESVDKENKILRSELADLRTDLDNIKGKMRTRESKSSGK